MIISKLNEIIIKNKETFHLPYNNAQRKEGEQYEYGNITVFKRRFCWRKKR